MTSSKVNNLQSVHERQSQLMNQYAAIEHRVAGNKPHATRIIRYIETQGVANQEHIRAIIWRGVEELNEARVESNPNLQKVELIDALHFFTEVNCFSGLDMSSLEFTNPDVEMQWVNGKLSIEAPDNFKAAMGEIVSRYCDATYQLKSKPWKQTPKKTDWDEFVRLLSIAYEEFICLLAAYMTHQECMDLYFGKAQENQTRQETGY